MKMNRAVKREWQDILFAMSVFVAVPSFAAAVNYVGSTTSGDIAEASNWGGTRPTTADTATFPVGFLCPLTGLSLGQPLTLGSIEWNETADRELDLGGKTLTLNDASDTSQISLGANAKLTIKNGTVDVTSSMQRFLPSGDYGTLVLTNMEMYIKSPNWRFTNSFGKGFCTKIMKGARVVCSELPPGDQRLPLIGKNDCELIIDGGFLSIKSQAYQDKRLAFNQTWENSVFKLLNGGVIEFTSPPANTAAIRFNGNPARVLIDGGAMYQTNALTWYTDNYGIRYANNDVSKPGFFAVTNSTIKGTRFSLCGTGGNVTFHNSDIDFYFNNHQYAGFSFYSASGRNSLTISGTTSFKAKTLTWESVSKSDSFLLAGGTFDAPISMSGTNGVFAMTGGNGTGVITMNGASNTVTFTGGKWTHSAANQIQGISNVFTIAETAVVTGTYTTVSGEGARLVQDGATAYGGMFLQGNGVTVHLKNGATRFAQHKSEGLQFQTGVSNATLIIDDATYENKGHFSGYYKGTASAYSDTGCTYTNCPGSAIEFRGTHPKFINSEATISAAAGGVFVAMTLGSFTPGTYAAGPVLGTEPLDNPLALRYILPANGYSEAPLQGTVSRNNGRPIALCGNARIEVDASGYSRPSRKTRIPLITDVANFTVGDYGYLMLDIDALNRNNAAYLPEDSKLEYIAADTTVYLTFASRMGMKIVIR